MQEKVMQPGSLQEPQEVENPIGGALYERYKKDGVYEYAKLPNGQKDKSRVKITYHRGTVYEGGINRGRYAGSGTYAWADGSYYKGIFKNGKLNGNGTYTASNGDQYEGLFRKNRYEGRGTYPSFSQLTMNVLYASDCVLVPFKPEYNSYKGIIQLFENIEQMKEIQPNLNVLGFAVTMARATKSAEEAIVTINDFAKQQKCQVFSPVIRLGVACADAPSYGKSVYAYKPESGVAQDYEQLAYNVLNELEKEE